MAVVVEELVRVLEQLKRKEAFLVVSPRQVSVMQQIAALQRHLTSSSGCSILIPKLARVRDVLQKLVSDCAAVKYKNFWQRFHPISMNVIPPLWEDIGHCIQTSIEPITYQAISRQWAEEMLPKVANAAREDDERQLTHEEKRRQSCMQAVLL